MGPARLLPQLSVFPAHAMVSHHNEPYDSGHQLQVCFLRVLLSQHQETYNHLSR